MNCRNCDSQNTRSFHNKVWSTDNGKVYKFNDCELIFITPIMNETEESEFYKNYNNHVKDRGVILQNSIEEFHERSKVIAKERLGVIKSFFKASGSNRKKILKVGSSTGAFLSLLSDCNTNACELATDNLEYSKKFINGNAYNSLEEVEENDFDVICMFHVFEHVKDPVHFLNLCKSLLKREGRIVIEVPCSDDPLITLYNCNEFKDFVFQPMHPMVYNEKSLDYVFAKSGYHKESAIYHQRYGLDNHLSWFKNKQPGGDAELTKFFGSNIEYKNKLEGIKKTDTIFYIAKVDSCI